MGEEHLLYFSSNGDLDFYPKNEPSAFENKIRPQIFLDPNKEYELALVNCLYPQKFLCVKGGSLENSIEVYGSLASSPNSVALLCTFVPLDDIESGDVEYMVRVLDSSINYDLKSFFGSKYEDYIADGKILTYNKKFKRIEVGLKTGECVEDRKYCSLFLKFSERMGQLLGFRGRQMYPIYKTPTEAREGAYMAPFPPRRDGNVDHIYIYCDAVSPSPYAGQLVNILSAFSMQDTGGKDFHTVLYKPLAKTQLESIAFRVTDQHGRNISYGENTTMTMVVHIRQK